MFDLGFGTSPFRRDGARVDVEGPVRMALAAGYRLFDLAEMYGTERAVGRALRGPHAPPRAELQLIGKAWHTSLRPGHLSRACEDSLHRIGTDAFDLYLLHAPEAWRHVAPLCDPEEIGWEEFGRRAAPRDEDGSVLRDDVPLQETWDGMRQLVRAGLAARVGVSNFTREQIASLGEPPPAANQIACWPLDADAVQWHAQQAIEVFGYSPLRDDVLETAAVRDIAAAYGRSPAQVVLRWLIQSGVRPLTFSTSPERIRENFGATTFALSAEDLRALSRVRPGIST